MTENEYLQIYEILGSDDIAVISTIHADLKAKLTLASKILKFSYQLIRERTIPEIKNISLAAEAVILSLYIQAFRLFRAIVSLCKMGQHTETEILLRSLLDVASYMLYISEKDQDERAGEYIHSAALSHIDGFDKMREIFPDQKIPEVVFEERKESEKMAVDYFSKKHGKKDIKGIKKCALRPHDASERINEYKDIIHKCRKILHKAASMTAHGDNMHKFVKISIEPDGNAIFYCNLDLSDNMIDECLRASTILIYVLTIRINKILDFGKDSYVEDIGKDIRTVWGSVEKRFESFNLL